MEQTNFSMLLNKKTKIDDKIKFLETLSINSNIETKLNSISYLLVVASDRNQKLQEVSSKLLNTFITSLDCNFNLTIFKELLKGVSNEQNDRTKLFTLELINRLTERDNFRNSLPSMVEVLSYLLADISKDVKSKTEDLFRIFFTKINNKDLEPLIPVLFKAFENMNEIPNTIDKISSTTFVQNVDAPTLAIITPLLLKTFQNNSTYAVKRQTIVIIENMTKLVEDAYHALEFIELLHPILVKAYDEIAEPEVRAVAERTLTQLEKIKNKGRTIADEKNNLVNKLTIDMNQIYREFIYSAIDTNTFTENTLSKVFGVEQVQKLLDIYNNENKTTDKKEEEITAEMLCSCEFTLGYGSKVLLHKTKMTLYRGFKYGLIGSNNSGKSTLMRAMASRQLESFPQELKSVYVETDILGELSHLSLVDYILQDERLKGENLSREMVEDYLKKFNFTEQMLLGGVSTLSGGWRMKLALSRAMMQNADILLMDEPSAHLDVINVKWLLDYIKSLTSVTCIIVSQNAKLLDECCDNIIQINNLKLNQYKGNLSKFAESHPEVSSYFELQTEKYKFKFPQPRFLDGVKSKGKALMKMDGITFTYPGNLAPTIRDASVQVSLSSRIGCLGPNGAGKSTSIKILTGQLEPQQGIVWTYPGLKIGYIAQHAFVHIEQHLEKTANEYIRWRYEGGEDKEDLQKITMTMSEEEIARLKREVHIEQENGSKVKKIIKRLTYGRRVGKREKEYECELENTSMDQNIWLTESDLTERGYSKLLKIIDSKCDAAESAYSKALTQQNVEEHLEAIGMTKENATHVKIKQLSNGEKVKVVIGAALWMCPHILILDEPTNNIDRDGLAALKVAINEFEGGIIIITHDEQFCNSICKEIWVIENCILNVKGDPEWMQNALKTKVESKQEEEMVDANGNVVKIKPQKKQLTRKEKMARQKYKQMLREQGEEVSDSDDD
jgi:elongation factor 3